MTDKEKILDRLTKLQAARESEAKIGNAEAAEAFARMINKMLLEHELDPTDIEYARMADKEPVIEMKVNLEVYHIRLQKTRIAWQEQLAGIVAKAHLCKLLIRPGSNSIWFVGTQAHATVAEYAYGTLVPIVDKLSDTEYYAFLGQCQREGRSFHAHGFRPAWLNAFIVRISERFDEARKAAVAEAHNQSTALVRLDQALVKVQDYMKEKYKTKSAGIGGKNSYHTEGFRAGRAAADRVVIGTRGVTGTAQRRQLL